MYEILKEKRESKGYTIEDLSRVIERSPATYFKKENGDVKFTVSEALKIADFLDEKVEKIFLKADLQ